MSTDNLLFEFEKKYPFLYEITAQGVPIYTCHRDAVLARLQKSGDSNTAVFESQKGRIFLRRLLDGIIKMCRFRAHETLIFTSSLYRRDEGRNLAAEYLMDKYPDAVVFEWPSRTEAYDAAYFADPQRGRYCPLDAYIVIYKLYCRLFRRNCDSLAGQLRQKLQEHFDAAPAPAGENEAAAIRYLMERLPRSYAETVFSQRIFRRLFRGYRNVKFAVDFWGSGRENIIPVLPRMPESVELQHGIITPYHPGYIYPEFVRGCGTSFFRRTLLVYGEKTKQLLTENSIFREEQIQVIGNPRIQMYKKLRRTEASERRLVLFASQPFEQDGAATGYYSAMTEYLRGIQKLMETDARWEGYRLGVKLHPRENDAIAELYRQALPGITVYGNATQLYELLSKSLVQLTVSSTTLYEAAEFDTPTIVLAFDNQNAEKIYGFRPWVINTEDDIPRLMERIRDTDAAKKYLTYLKEMSANFN